MRKLNISLDCDGVITETIPYWMDLFNSHVDMHKHPKLINEISSSSFDFGSVCPICFHHCLYDPLPYKPVPGSISTIKHLSSIANLWIISHRPIETYESTKDWFVDQGLAPYIQSIFVVGKEESKLKICKSLHVYIHLDDSPSVIEEFANSDVNIVIYDQPWNSYVSGARVKSWEEFASLVDLRTMQAYLGA